LKGPGKEDVVGVMGDDDCCGTYASGSSWKLYTNVQGIQQGLRFSVALIQLSLQYLRREAGQKFREGQATMQEKWRELNGRRLERLGQALGEKEKILDEKKERLNAWHQNLGDWHRDLEGWNKTLGDYNQHMDDWTQSLTKQHADLMNLRKHLNHYHQCLNAQKEHLDTWPKSFTAWTKGPRLRGRKGTVAVKRLAAREVVSRTGAQEENEPDFGNRESNFDCNGVYLTLRSDSGDAFKASAETQSENAVGFYDWCHSQEFGELCVVIFLNLVALGVSWRVGWYIGWNYGETVAASGPVRWIKGVFGL